MSDDTRYTDEELLGSVMPSLEPTIARGSYVQAWAMGATWARRPLLMGDVLAHIRRARELYGEVSDEQLAYAVVSGLSFDRLVINLEYTARARRYEEFAARVLAQERSEAAERAANPAKQAEYEALRERERAIIDETRRRAAAGEVLGDDADALVARLRELTADGAGHQMALEALTREEAYRHRRVRLVRAVLRERIPEDQCPPWALAIFEESEAVTV